MRLWLLREPTLDSRNEPLRVDDRALCLGGGQRTWPVVGIEAEPEQRRERRADVRVHSAFPDDALSECRDDSSMLRSRLAECEERRFRRVEGRVVRARDRFSTEPGPKEDPPRFELEYHSLLGPHPALIDLLAARIAAVAGDTPPAVLLVGRGSTDPDANADVVKTARLLWEGRDYPLAETAFVSLARPDVAEGLERCRLLGARRIVVARYFLFPGVLPDRVAEQSAAYAAAHPELEIACAGVLGDCDEIAALVWERYHEALAGDIRMNCDVCVYRIAMPGFEHRVGEPQHPHDHPHDHVHAHG